MLDRHSEPGLDECSAVRLVRECYDVRLLLDSVMTSYFSLRVMMIAFI